MIKLALFHPNHFDVMDLASEDVEGLEANRSVFEAAMKTGGMVTATTNGRILYIAGYYQLHSGVFELFVIPSIYVPEHPIVFHRSVQRWIDSILEEEPGIHRLQTLSIGLPERDTWMEALGFVCEGTLFRYTKSGQDWRMWAIVQWDSKQVKH
jgi:hypothetical protein